MKKEKTQTKKSIKIVSAIFIILLILAMVFLIYSIYLISGIETEIRYFVMIVVFVINIILLLLLNGLLKKNKLAKYIIFIILTSILIGAQGYLGYFVFKTYSSLDSLNKDKITYTSAIVTLNDSKYSNIEAIKDSKIGIVKDNTSIDGYVIGLEIIKDNNLSDNNTIVDYEDFSALVADLYEKKLDVIIISSNYVSMFKSIDDYENITTETKIIYEKSKTLTKDEIANYTGDEIVNFNTSNSVTEPFTMLVMGIDSTAETLNKNATGNGDALMVITFNPKTLNATMLSIPRDTYVPIACFSGQRENKITHAAWNGESCMIKTIQNFTGIKIDYYVKINFKGVVKLVNALGGIEVNVPMEFCESNSNRSTKKSNLICLKKGEQTLNGEQALALARHRKTLLTGDLQRGLNQQLVVQGMLNKVRTIKSTGQVLDILDTVSKNMDTNFTTKQMLSFYDILKNLLLTSSSSSNFINIQQLYLSGSNQGIYDEGIKLVLSDYIPNQSSLKQIVNAMKQNLEKSTTTMDKKINFNIEEDYAMKIIGRSNLRATSVYSLLPNFVGKTESYTTSWLNTNGISYTIVDKTVTDGSTKNGYVTAQSLPVKKRLDLIKGSITITVARVQEITEPVVEEPIVQGEPEQGSSQAE